MEKYYGILFDRQPIDLGIYFYKPMYLVEGTVKETELGTYFVDAINDEYLLMDDSDTILEEETKVIGHIIKEDSLKKEYPQMDEKELKSMFFDETKSYAFLGFYDANKDIIKIVNFSLRDIASNIDKNIVFESEKKVETFLPKKFYDKLMHFYHTSYATLKNLKSEDEIRSSIDITTNGFMTFLEYIDKQNISEDAKEYIFDKIFLYIDELNSIKEKKYDDMQKSLTRIYTSYNIDFVNIGNLLLEKEVDTKEIVSKEKIPNVKKIKKYFDDKIIGQEEAKKDVIASIIMNKYSKNPSDKNACLLVGPSGSGKTLIAETVAEYFDMPIEIIDTTQLTMPGYVGANIEDFLSRLISKANYDVNLAEHGIVVFDEVDKKGTKSNGDVSGKGVLNTLLPFLQGTTYNVRCDNGSIVHFNTKNLTIFATGAFTDVTKNKEDIKHNRIGFISDEVNEKRKYERLDIEDFVRYGNMPIEIMGRFSVITMLDGHTKESLKEILSNSSISPIKIEKDKLSNIGINLIYDSSFLDEVATEALKLKTGARALKSIVERSVKVARWEALENIGEYETIILSSETVNDNTKYKIIDRYGNMVREKVKTKKKEG